MPRTPKPFYWRDGWYTDFGGERKLLAKGKENKTAAEDELLRLRHKQLEQDGKVYPDMTVLQLIDLFLDAVKVEKSEHTYADYSRWLHEFAKQHGHRRVRSVTRLMAQQFRNEWAKKEYKKGKVYQPKTINHALIGLRRCWNWGIDAAAVGMLGAVLLQRQGAPAEEPARGPPSKPHRRPNGQISTAIRCRQVP